MSGNLTGLCLNMLTLVSGVPVSKGKVNRSLDLCLIAKETTRDCEHEFVYLLVICYNINTANMATFIVLRHPVTIPVTALTNQDNLTKYLSILKPFDNKQIFS